MDKSKGIDNKAEVSSLAWEALTLEPAPGFNWLLRKALKFFRIKAAYARYI